MVKFIIGTLLKITIRNLKFVNKVLQKFTLLKPIITFFKNNKTLIKIIAWLHLYTIWRGSFKGLRIIGALFNLFLVILFLDYKSIDLGIPALIGFFISILSIFPDSIQDFFISMFAQSWGFISRIYNKLKDNLARLIEYTMRSEETPSPKENQDRLPKSKDNAPIVKQVDKVTPKVPRNTPKSDWSFPWNRKDPIDLEPKDSLRKLYKDSRGNDMPIATDGSNYIYYIVAGVVVIASGFLVYYYWDNIINLFKKGEDKGKGRETFPSLNSVVDNDNSTGSESTISRDYPEGYLTYFKRKLNGLFNRTVHPENTIQPTRVYDDGFTPPFGNYPAVWKGLPLPRKEYTPEGKEYIMFLDKDNIVNILDNRRSNRLATLINPRTNKTIGFTEFSESEVYDWWNKDLSFFEAPANSYIWNADPGVLTFPTRMPPFSTLDIPESSLPAPIIPPNTVAESIALKLGKLPNTSTIKTVDPDATPRVSLSNLPKLPSWAGGSTESTPKAPNIELPGAKPTIPSLKLPSSTPDTIDIQFPVSPSPTVGLGAPSFKFPGWGNVSSPTKQLGVFKPSKEIDENIWDDII